MIRLLALPSSATAEEVVRRLGAEGVEATVTREGLWSGIDGGAMQQAIIWIAAETDRPAALAVAREVMNELSDHTCTACGYDLSGHTGSGRCPECGAAMTVRAHDMTCKGCGEIVPGNFDTCWSCGLAMGTGKEESE